MGGGRLIGGSVSQALSGLRHWSRPTKILVAIAYDFAACLTVGLAVALIPGIVRGGAPLDLGYVLGCCVVAGLIAVIGIAMLRGYSTVVRFMGPSASFTFAISLVVAAAVWLTMLQRAGQVASPAGLLFCIATFALIYGSRSLLNRSDLWFANGKARVPVVIYGAGESGRQLTASLEHDKTYRTIAFVDDDASLHGLWVNGLRVYAPENLPQMIATYKIREVFLALPRVSQDRRREILHTLADHALKVQTIPSLSDILSGEARLHELRPVEIEDVLGREPVAPDPILLSRNIDGKAVLVTGAGGSIGSELCRSIFTLKPRILVLFDNSEHSLFKIDHELREYALNNKVETTRLHSIMGSVGDSDLIVKTLQEYGIDTVFHAAAYKHVPLVEMNVAEGVRNNVLGTKVLVDALPQSNVSAFVMISTDKAVRPTSVMGASKRVAELLVQAAAAKSDRCKMSIVRFGNVLGSSGSVLPTFRAQIEKGGPITVTHAEVTRFFMTIPEAAQLVIQAGALGEHGEVFHLDMGEPVRILDLARRFVRLHGLRERTPDGSGDIDIKIIGLRPGEKLYEELLIDSHALATEHPRIFRARERFLQENELAPIVARISSACQARDETAIISQLRLIVEGFGVSFGTVDGKPSKPQLRVVGNKSVPASRAPHSLVVETTTATTTPKSLH